MGSFLIFLNSAMLYLHIGAEKMGGIRKAEANRGSKIIFIVFKIENRYPCMGYIKARPHHLRRDIKHMGNPGKTYSLMAENRNALIGRIIDSVESVLAMVAEL